MRICAIGTSHLVALKFGWDILAAEFPTAHITFFGSPAMSLRHLRSRGKKLVSVDAEVAKNLAYTSGGKSEILAADYDVFLLVGMNLNLPRLTRGYSRAVALATAADSGAKGLCQRTVVKLRRITRRPIWIAPSPLEMAPNDAHEAAEFHGYDVLFQAMAQGFPEENVRFLPQPAETIGPDMRAPARFGVGSIRLLPDENGVDLRVHPEDDVRHMNSDYGVLWLRQNLPVILAESGAVQG